MVKKDYVELATGEVIYKGTLYPGRKLINQKITFNSKKWFNHWEKEIEEIKKSKFDYGQIQMMYEHFVRDVLFYGYSKQMIKKHQQVNELSDKLNRAFNQSYSNYRESKKGFWGFVLGLFVHKAIDKIKTSGVIPKG
jgi:hypothetical protein